MNKLAANLLALAMVFVAWPAAAAAPPQDVVPPAAVPADYVIGPGDTLQVFVFRNPELNVTIPVRPDGKISTPLVEDMVAVGKNPSQLARDIETVLSEYVRTPQVNVIVTQAASAFRQVKVLGQVNQPQALAYREGMTVLDAILAVGGVSQFAAGNRSKIVRTADGRQTEIKIRLNRILKDGDMKENMRLQPGDVLIVPESRF